MKRNKINRLKTGSAVILAVLLCLSLASLVGFSAPSGNAKSDGIHVKNVPAGVATVTIGTLDGQEIVIDGSEAHGIQWELDRQCEERNVKSITLNYPDGTDVPLQIVYRTDRPASSDTDCAIVGNTGNGTLDIWIRPAEKEEITSSVAESTAVPDETSTAPESTEATEATAAPTVTTAPEESTAVPEDTGILDGPETPGGSVTLPEETILAPEESDALEEPPRDNPAPEDPGTAGGRPAPLDPPAPEDPAAEPDGETEPDGATEPDEVPVPEETPSGAIVPEGTETAPDTGDRTYLWVALLGLAAAVGGWVIRSGLLA